MKHPVDQLVRHTNSAVDIRTVFGQIGTFWLQLSWPDPETSYVFVNRMLDDVCKSAIFYAEKMCARAAGNLRPEEEDDLTEKVFKIFLFMGGSPDLVVKVGNS